MSSQFKQVPVPNAKTLNISQQMLDKILSFDKDFTGREHAGRILAIMPPNRRDVAVFVSNMMEYNKAVELGMEKSISFKAALKEVRMQSSDGKIVPFSSVR